MTAPEEWDDGVHRMLTLAERMPFGDDLDLGDIYADDGGESLKPYLVWLERLAGEVDRVRDLLDPAHAVGSPANSTDYRDAAVALWGEAGAYAYDSYARMRAAYFPDLPAEIPIVIGLTAYGRCLGLTRGAWEHGPRISLHPTMAFGRGGGFVDDVMVHECLHAWLRQTGRDPAHDSEDWYAEVRRLSPAVLGRELNIHRGSDRRSVRVPNPKYAPGNGEPRTLVRKVRIGEEHARVAGWPHTYRPADYDYGKAIPCPTY